MDQDGDGDAPERIVGLPVDEAVDAVVARDEDRDPETVRATLERVAEDGAVTREGVDDALAHAAKVVATPETRVELAADALDSAREAAAPVSDLDAVAARLDAFEARFDAVEAQVAELGPALRDLLGWADDEVYAVAVGVRRLTEEANAAQRVADDLQMDLESFERWVGDPDRRSRELAEDLDALTAHADDLAAAADRIADAGDADDAGGRGDAADRPADAADVGDGVDRPTDAGGLGDADDGVEDPGLAWFDATLRHRVLALLLADLRAELADLRTWADREDIDADPAAGVAERLDDLDERRVALGERLDGLARPTWTDRFGERVSAFEAAMEAFEPPVAWGEVQATLDDHRVGVEESG